MVPSPSINKCRASENDDAIALMTAYIHDELSLETRIQVSSAISNCESCQKLHLELLASAISNCESCQKLHLELLEFFDESKNSLYELEYPDEIRRTDQFLDELFDAYSLVTPSRKTSDLSYKIADLFEGECLGQGA